MTGGEAAGGWLLGKLAPALGGLFGGLSLAMFWTPEKLREKGKILSIFIAGGISAMAGFAFTSSVAVWLGLSSEKIDLIIGLAWFLGLLSIAVMNWVGNLMGKYEHMDIAEVAQKINAVRKRLQGSNGPATRPRKTPARTAKPTTAKAPAKPRATRAPKPRKAQA